MKAVSFAAGRLYLLLLHLYPRTFSERFAGDMFADFRDGYTEARRRGAWATNAFVGRSFGDLAVSLVSQWRASAAFARPSACRARRVSARVTLACHRPMATPGSP